MPGAPAALARPEDRLEAWAPEPGGWALEAEPGAPCLEEEEEEEEEMEDGGCGRLKLERRAQISSSCSCASSDGH